MAATAAVIFGVRWDPAAAGYSSFSSFFFRGLRRALQDLYEDWSAIYRNRIPPYLTLPLARSSQPPLCLTAFPLFLLLLLVPFPSYTFPLLLAAFIHSFSLSRRLFLLFVPLLFLRLSLLRFFF